MFGRTGQSPKRPTILQEKDRQLKGARGWGRVEALGKKRYPLWYALPILSCRAARRLPYPGVRSQARSP